LQIRGEAGPRQVSGAKLALQHNLGLGGAVVVALYQKGFSSTGQQTRAYSTRANQTSDKMVAGDDFKCAPVFNMLAAVLETEGADLVKKVNGVFGFKVSEGPGGKEAYWVVDVKNGKGGVSFDGKGSPDVTLQLSDQDLFDLMSGTLNAQKAFFQGKLKIKGNIGLAMKLREFQSQIEKATAAKL